MEYVAGVLPSLGESSVVQSPIDRLPELGDVRVRASEPADVARLKGDIRMAEVVQRAVAQRVRIPDEDLGLDVGRAGPVLPAEEIARMVSDAWRSGRTYLGARDVFRREFVALAHERVGERRGLFRSGPDPSEVGRAATAAADRIWPTVTAPQVLRDLLAGRGRMEAAVGPALNEEG
jgi:hypothetical protein